MLFPPQLHSRLFTVRTAGCRRSKQHMRSRKRLAQKKRRSCINECRLFAPTAEPKPWHSRSRQPRLAQDAWNLLPRPPAHTSAHAGGDGLCPVVPYTYLHRQGKSATPGTRTGAPSHTSAVRAGAPVLQQHIRKGHVFTTAGFLAMRQETTILTQGSWS